MKGNIFLAPSSMKKYKPLIVAFILVIPSVVYLFLSYGNHNFAHLPYVGNESDSTYYTIPYFEFINQFGDTVSQSDYEGNIYLANFIFTTCPTICPVMTYNMRRIQQKMTSFPQFKIISHSVFPEYDSPEILLAYAKDMEADLTNWNFVTGKREAIYNIAKYYFVSAMQDDSAPGGFLHSEYFVLVDKEGRIRAREDDNGNNIGVYDGTSDYEIDLLIDDIKVLMAEYNLATKKNDE